MSGIVSSSMEFKNYKVFNYTLAGRPLVIETGKMAGLANGSVLIRYGETVLLCCATVYIKAHYLVDAFAGVVTGVLFYCLTAWIFDRYMAEKNSVSC